MFSVNVIKLIKEDMKLDAELEQLIKNAVVYELRHWRIPKKRAKTMETEERGIENQKKAFELFNQGLTNQEVQAELKMSAFSIWNYRKIWKAGEAKQVIKTTAWFKEQYPGLHDGLYQALADGKISESIITRNAW